MTVLARGSSLLRGLLGRGPALGGSAAPAVVSPGTAGRASAGFRSSGVRTSREKRFHPPEVATVCLPTCPYPQSSFKKCYLNRLYY
uniref:probable bifunctional methylenetetrahydrofolate dehydrogenase/cyclohydrolase 2 isoform X5 n=1 Tax=Ictidomys tridecemlineatus TaxID=43179 RepID=UPI001A9FA476|nr:probable bifunctional methylenetetrahydrofolate dehydrogenase/cyclohydrolase 2 isoform X5 [Ictidomys tridecemlineatus]